MSSPSGNSTGPPTSGAGPAGGPPMDPALLPHDSLQANIICAVIITWVISAVFVAARFYTRYYLVRVIALTDWFLLLSLVFSLGVTISDIMQVQYGMGAHIWDLSPRVLNVPGILESEWFNIVFYALTLGCIKVSILLLYTALFNRSWLEKAVWATLAFVVVSHIWMYYTIFSICVPLNAFWDTTVQGNCHPGSFLAANNYIHIATDFLIFLLPIPVVWRLQVNWRQRLLLLAVFGLGFFVVMISIIRVTYVTQLLANQGMDFTYSTVEVFYWTEVETNAAIICASAMTMRPLISRWVPRMFSTHPYSDQSRSAAAAAARNQTIGSQPSRQAFPSKTYPTAASRTLISSGSWPAETKIEMDKLSATEVV